MRLLCRRTCTLALAIAMAAPVSAAAQDTPDIVFAGGSILRRWTALAAQMTPLRVVNVSLDGATTCDLLGMLGSRVIPRKPKVVVYYGGSNDIDLGESAKAIVARVVQP